MMKHRYDWTDLEYCALAEVKHAHVAWRSYFTAHWDDGQIGRR